MKRNRLENVELPKCTKCGEPRNFGTYCVRCEPEKEKLRLENLQKRKPNSIQAYSHGGDQWRRT